jgi:predicted RecA/RadA family phage recombinase
MAAEAQYLQEGDSLDYTPVIAVTGGQVAQLSDGRCGISPVDIAAAAKGAVETEGVFLVQKTASVAILAGGRVYWDYSANTATYQKVNDQDFYMGRATADAAGTDTTVYVEINVDPQYDITLTRDAFASVPTGTQAVGAFGYPKTLGGARLIELTATSEAQCIDLLSVDKFAIAANAIVEAIIRVPVNGSGAAVDFNIGVGNGTSTTDADAITEHVLFHVDGASLAINAQSKDGTTTVAATDTTKVFVAGSAVANRVEFWLDTRDPTDVQLYVNGVNVLPSSVFTLAAATGPLSLIAHLEKTTGTTTGQFIIDALRCRLMDQ